MKIICLGDSLTAGYRVPPESCWVRLLDVETPHTWINAGVSGDTTAGLLVRLQTEVLPQNPDAVLIMGGSNDIALTGVCTQAQTNLMAMVHQCVARGVRPVVGIPLPIVGIPEQWRPAASWELAPKASQAYIRWLRAFADAFGLRNVDFAEAVAAQGGERLYQPDGLHPNVEGHRVMADAVKRRNYFLH